MKRPRIYGNEAECRATVARYVESAEALLGHAVDVRSQVVAQDRFSQEQFLTGGSFITEDEWAREVQGWFEHARVAMSRYLEEQLQNVLPIIDFGLPRTTGKPSYATQIDRNEPWLRRALEELREFRDVLAESEPRS